MTTLRCFYIIMILCLLPVHLYGQGTSSLQQLQGFWKQYYEDEDRGYQRYNYYEGHSLYTISHYKGELIVLKYYVAFYDQIPEDSIALKDLNEDGEWYGFIDHEELKGNPRKIIYTDFNNYSYDLEEGSFNYYGGSPFVFGKIKSLPADLYAQF